MVRQSILPLIGQVLAEKFAFAAGGGKLTLGKRRVGQLQAGVTLLEQGLEIKRWAEGGAAQREVIFCKAGLVKATCENCYCI